MQGKGIIITAAVILGLLCLNALMPTAYVMMKENKASELSDGSQSSINTHLEKLAKDTLNLGITSLNYYDAKEKEVKLGLDLKGGMNVTLEISVKDLLLSLADKSQNPVFRKALANTDEVVMNSQGDYLTEFFKEFDKAKVGTTTTLSSFDVFGNLKNADKVNQATSEDEAKKFVQEEIKSSINQANTIFTARLDALGTTQPNVQKIGNTGRISVEMPGETDTERIEKLLQSSAKLEFWRVMTRDQAASLLVSSSKGIAQKSIETYFDVNVPSSGVASIKIKDTAAVNTILKSPQFRSNLSVNKYAKFLWSAKPEPKYPKNVDLYVLEGNAKDENLLNKDGKIEANVESNEFNQVGIGMTMKGALISQWAEVTNKNIGRQIAIVLDGMVYSAPNVNSAINEGRSRIDGNFSRDEARDLVNVLGAGKLPASAKIVQSDVVGPSLGQEAIDAGLLSMGVAFIVILFWMVFYYGRAGMYANIAVTLNLFFIIGIMVEFGFTFTLPGIAGIILTMGMAVDANIITFERIKDELRKGLSVKEAESIGTKHALAAIIDGNVTTLIVAIILWIFGTGPIKGFAISLTIGILCTLFTAILITRVLMEKRIKEEKPIAFTTSITKNWFQNVKFKWMDNRIKAYLISLVLLIISIGFIAVKGLNLGIDFSGGRTYEVKINQVPNTPQISEKLSSLFVDETGKPITVEVKTIGNNNRIKVSTKYKINDDNAHVEKEIKQKLFEGLKNVLPAGANYQSFSKGESYGIESSRKVGPTIVDDLKIDGLKAFFLALAGIFLYILLRFNKWQFSLGGVTALFHDAIIVIGCFSVFYGILPMHLEVDQAFIAAILTIVGYSINDTVIVYDRIRENLNIHPTVSLKKIIDDSINQTLGRTLNTVATVMFVIIVIFIFGGNGLRSFMFALMIGIGFGTYSSIFIASALTYDFLKGKLKNRQAE